MKRLFLLGLLGMTMNMQAAEVDTLKSVELQDVQVHLWHIRICRRNSLRV